MAGRHIDRRQLLRGGVAAAGLLGLGVAGRARGQATVPVGPLPQPEPGPSPRPYKILQIYLHGAPSHRETFWIEPSPGGDAWPPLLNAGGGCPGSHFDHTEAGLPSCNVSFLPGLELGPSFQPLADAGVLHRARLVALSHAVPAHRAAAHMALTGHGPGRPAATSLGAAIKGQYGASPLGSVVFDAGVDPLVVDMATQVGSLSAAHRPIVLSAEDPGLAGKLDQDRSELAAARAHYAQRYRDRLRPQGTAPPVAARHFQAYEAARAQLDASREIVAALFGADQPPLRCADRSVSAHETPVGPCSDRSYANNPAVRAVKMAAFALSRPEVMHAGALVNGGLTGFDTHHAADRQQHAAQHIGNLWGIVRALAWALAQGYLDLDETLVVLHPEFGRAARGASHTGTDHWTRGYGALLLGGPVQQGTAGRLNFSHLGNGVAENGFEPKQLHAALMLAAGVDPFNAGFDASDLEPNAPPSTITHHLRTALLGQPALALGGGL